MAAGLHLVAGLVSDDLAVGVGQLAGHVAEIEVKLSVGTKGEGVDPVVVLGPADLGEEGLLAVGLQVPVLVGHDPDVVPGGDDDLVPKDTDPVGGINLSSLVEDRRLVGLAIPAGVLENQDAVSFRALVAVAPVVDDLTDPDAAEMIDVDAGRTQHHRFRGKEGGFESIPDVEIGNRLLGGLLGKGREG